METILPLAGVLAIAVLAVLAFFVVLYVWPGARTASQGSVEATPGERFILRTYRGHELRDAVGAYAADAADLEAKGYESMSQTWGTGSGTACCSGSSFSRTWRSRGRPGSSSSHAGSHRPRVE